MARRYLYGYWGALVALLLSACERSDMSPVEIKISDDYADDYAVSSSLHKVREDETLFDIAYRYNVDPMNLAKINGIKAPYKIRKGQLLRLPKSDGDGDSAVVVNSEDKSVIRSYEDDENTENADDTKKTEKAEDKKRDRLDEEFDGIINGKPAVPSSPKQEADALSKPKIVENASGAPTEKEVPESDGKLIWPVKGKVISEFGDINDEIPNDGIYIKANAGTNVKAADSGKVISAKNDEDFGNIIAISHDSKLMTVYAHLKDMKVKVGDTVKVGDVIRWRPIWSV
ncbi:peptidase M23 [Alphaproteobacteria bacterium]|nr:peptidase M23 [Alphaproteobacteria bacterium]